MEILLFKLGDDSYGVSLDDVDEVLHLPALRHIAAAPPFLAGVLNLRGELLPVIDMMERLQLQRDVAPPPMSSADDTETIYPRGTRLLVTSDDLNGTADTALRYAVIMDSWRGIREFDDTAYRESILTDESKAPFINGLNLEEQGMSQQILLRHLLYDDEKAVLATRQLSDGEASIINEHEVLP